MTIAATSARRGLVAFRTFDPVRAARPALVGAVIAAGLLLFHLTRGTSFWADEWIWIVTRRGSSAAAFLAPYNGHLSLVPIAIYRAMFAIFGIGSYTPYRALVIALSLLVPALVFVYARTRVGELVALVAATLMLFLAPGWQDMMWAFQIPWLIVCAAGIVALMLIERRTRMADVGACVLSALAIASTSLGVAFAIGLAIELALTRRRWRDAWIVGVPLALYVIWALHYQPSLIDTSAIPTIPLGIAKAAAAAVSSLAGISGIRPFDETGTSLIYGWPLLVVGAVLALRRARTRRPSARAASLAAIFVVFAASVSVVHGVLTTVLSSRYIYVYSLLVVLLAVELAHGMRRSRLLESALCVVALAAVIANIGDLRAFGAYIRGSGATTNGALTALDLDRGIVAPGTPARIALYPFVTLSARSYFDAERALGTPAYSLAQLRHADALAQSAADAQLLADRDVTVTAGPPVAGASASLGTIGASNGTVARAGGCVRFSPAAALAPGSTASMTLTVLPGRLSLRTGPAPANVSIRRFAAGATPLATLAALRSSNVTVRRDSAPGPWYLTLTSIAPVQACP